MAETKNSVEVRNETPLDIEVASIGSRILKPLEVADLEPSGFIWATFSVPALGEFLRLYHPLVPPSMLPPQQALLPPVVTVDLATVARGQEPDALSDEERREIWSGLHRLQVSNETIHVADLWVLDRTGDYRMRRIAPGETWACGCEPRRLFHFRTPAGLTLGAFCQSKEDWGRKEPAQVKLTTAYLDAWQAFQRRPQSTSRALGALRLIGERRASTPDPDDPLFISASTVRLDISEEPFNGVENREVRDVEIAGPLLKWSKSNRILSGYYGENTAADIRSLTIFCDRMEVADSLRFPRTNVTIYARELVFIGSGRIDTTPRPSERAKSKYLTEHPDNPKIKVPADVDGEPTYQAADGHKGEPGGNVTVYARVVSRVDDPGIEGAWEGAPSVRFICRGGKGQQGEAGGLKGYVRGEGQPEKYSPLPAVTADQVARAFKEAFKLECWHFSWPGKVDWPSQMPYKPWETYNVVEVSVFAFSGIWWCRYLHLPSPTHKDGAAGEFNTTIAAPRRCNSRDAYPGGWPGDGGDGGSLKLVTEKPAEGIAALQDAGAMGDPTLPVRGDTADERVPAHMRMTCWDKEVGHERDPEMHIEADYLSSQKDELGRAARPPAEDLRHDKYKLWMDDYVTDLQNRAFYTRPNTGRRGGGERIVRSDLSWAQPAAMAAVLNHARTAFRNGFREDAARALAPYHAVTVVQADAVARCSPDVQLAFGQMVALYNRLALNVDYYGNPPGWVPRLNALSNLKVLQGIREAACGAYYFADRMLQDAEALEDLRETSVQTTNALEAEMKVVKERLQEAYERLPTARDKLNQAQKLVLGVEADIVKLRKEAIARSVDKVIVQRFVSAALQMVDGVAKSLPIGQPFVGLAGSVFGAAAKIDWTAEKPLETAGAAVAHLSGQVDTFVTTKADAVASAVTRTRRGQALETEDLVTKLTREQEDAAQEPADAAKAVETSWRDFKSEEHKRLEAKIKTTEEAVRKIKEGKDEDSDPDGQTASAFLEALRKQRDAINPAAGAVAKTVAPLQKELVEYRKRQFELINAAQKVARMENAKLKALAETPKHLLPPTIEQKLAAVTRLSEDQKTRIERREATAKETMTQFESLGTGIATVGNAIITMATPVTDQDPTVQRLADELLVSDPVLRAEGSAMAKKLQGLMVAKKQAVVELLRWQEQATTSLATVMRNLATVSQLSRQRQSIDMGLNPAAKAYLKETRDAAKDALAASVYWFVKSYQYEFLKDVPDSFFNFDSWASELQKQEKTKLEQQRKKLEQAAPAADPATGQGPVVTRAPKILLSKEDFGAISEAVFKAELLNLGKDLLTERQSRGPNPVGGYEDCVLQRTDPPKDDWAKRQIEMLDALEQHGEVAFDFVRDFGKGSYDWNNARVAQVDLVKLEIEASDPNLTLTFRVEQRGEAVIAKKVDDKRQFYLFRAGRDDDPVGWTFVYNHQKRRTASGITKTKVDDPLGALAKELISSTMTCEEYQPALISDYLIRITDLKGAGGERKGLKSIKALSMTVSLSGG